MQTAGANQNTAGALTLLGGLVAAVAGALDWIDFKETGAADTTFKGTELNAGLGSIFFGIILIIIGIVLFVRGARSGGRAASITGIVIAALVLFAGAYTALAPGDSLVQFESSDLAEFYDISESQAKAIIEQGLASGDLEAGAMIGAWVAAAGGLLALLGGIMGVANSRRIREGQAGIAAPPPTAPATGEAPPQA